MRILKILSNHRFFIPHEFEIDKIFFQIEEENEEILIKLNEKIIALIVDVHKEQPTVIVKDKELYPHFVSHLVTQYQKADYESIINCISFSIYYG